VLGKNQPPVYRVALAQPLGNFAIPQGHQEPIPILPFTGVRLMHDGTFSVPYNCWGAFWRTAEAAGNKVIGAELFDGTLPAHVPEPDEWMAQVRSNPRLKPEAIRRMEHTAFQADGVRFNLSRGGSHTWCAPGSGKSTLGIVGGLWETGRFLFVTRGGTKHHICSQIRTLSNVEPFMAFGDTPTPEILDKAAEHQVIVVGYEILPGWKEFFRRSWKPERIVWDEIHRLASHKSHKVVLQQDGRKRFEKLDNWVAAAKDITYKAEWRYGMTATPVGDRIRGLWGQLNAVEPGHWGSYESFTASHCQLREGNFGRWDKGEDRIDLLRERLQNVVYFVPHSITHAGLPPLRMENFTLSPEQQNRPSAFAAEIKAAQKSGDQARVTETLLLLAASRKHAYTLETVDEAVSCQQKVVVFSGRRLDTERLLEATRRILWKPYATREGQLDSWIESVEPETGLPPGFAPAPQCPEVMGADYICPVGTLIPVWGGHGDLSGTLRNKIADAYQAHQGPGALIGTAQAWGEGIDLNNTDLALAVMLPYTPKELEQTVGRFDRLSPGRSCLFRFVIAARSADERVAAILLDKLPTVQAVTGSERAGVMHDVIEGVKGHEKEIFAAIADMLEKQQKEEGE
jgi:hypothetical protein